MKFNGGKWLCVIGYPNSNDSDKIHHPKEIDTGVLVGMYGDKPVADIDLVQILRWARFNKADIWKEISEESLKDVENTPSYFGEKVTII